MKLRHESVLQNHILTIEKTITDTDLVIKDITPETRKAFCWGVPKVIFRATLKPELIADIETAMPTPVPLGKLKDGVEFVLRSDIILSDRISDEQADKFRAEIEKLQEKAGKKITANQMMRHFIEELRTELQLIVNQWNASVLERLAVNIHSPTIMAQSVLEESEKKTDQERLAKIKHLERAMEAVSEQINELQEESRSLAEEKLRIERKSVMDYLARHCDKTSRAMFNEVYLQYANKSAHP